MACVVALVIDLIRKRFYTLQYFCMYLNNATAYSKLLQANEQNNTM